MPRLWRFAPPASGDEGDVACMSPESKRPVTPTGTSAPEAIDATTPQQRNFPQMAGHNGLPPMEHHMRSLVSSPDARNASPTCRFLDRPCQGKACLFWTPRIESASVCVTQNCLSGLACLDKAPPPEHTPSQAFSALARLLLSAPASWSAAALGQGNPELIRAVTRACSRFCPALDARAGHDPRRGFHRLARLLSLLGPGTARAVGMPRRMAAYAFWEFWDFQFLDSDGASAFLAACPPGELAALAAVLDEESLARLTASATADQIALLKAARAAPPDCPTAALAVAGDALERATLLCEDGLLLLALPGFPASFRNLEPLPEAQLPAGLTDCTTGCCPLLDAACLREGCALWDPAEARCGVSAWNAALFESGQRPCPESVRAVLSAALGLGDERVFQMLALPVKAAIWADFAFAQLTADSDDEQRLDDSHVSPRMLSFCLAGMGRADRVRLKATALEIRPELSALPVGTLLTPVDALAALSDRDFRELLKELSNEVLTQSLANAGDALREKCRLNLSERAFEMIREDVGLLRGVRLGDVEGAQRQAVRTAFRLAREGVINLPKEFDR